MRFVRIFFLAVLVLCSAPAWAEPLTVTFLHTNDVYEIAPRGGRGGLAELMALLKQERAAHPFTITTFGGDLISPSLLSGMTKGAHMVALMNALGTDVAVLGNHEFDHGPAVLGTRIGESKFPWLGTNVLGKDGKPALGTLPRVIIERGGYKFGFFGLLSAETKDVSNVGPDITFADIKASSARAIADLKAEGADVIVAITHQNLADDRALAHDVKGINLILGGHDHDPITFLEGGVLIEKAGKDAYWLAAIDMTIDAVGTGASRRLQISYGWRLLPTHGVAPDPAIKPMVDNYQSTLEAGLSDPVGITNADLDGRGGNVRTGEATLGNLITDAMRDSVKADVALLNGGGIRGDRLYPAGTTITQRNIMEEMPFGNVTMLLAVRGSDLRAALENGVSRVQDYEGRFPQVSGMSFVFDPKAPAGHRIVEVKVGGAPLDSKKTYKLATNDYVATGGDGYAMFRKAKVLIDASSAKLVTTETMDYIRAHTPLDVKLEGRSRRK